MDPRLDAVLAEQLGSGLPGLAGSEIRMTIRVAQELLDRTIAASLPAGGAVRAVSVMPRAGNSFDVSVTLAKPAFLPALHANLAVVRQPALPAEPVLVLRLTGGAGHLLKMAGPLLGGSLRLPEGIRLDQDQVLVDLRALLAAHGQSSHLRYAREITVKTEEGVVLVGVIAAVPISPRP